MQKKIAAERFRAQIIKSKSIVAEKWVSDFIIAYEGIRADKKNYKESLQQFFGTSEAMAGFVSETICRFEERTPERWVEAMKILREGMKIVVLEDANDSKLILPEKVLSAQLKSKGGQLIEIYAKRPEKRISLCLCETIEGKLVIIFMKDESERDALPTKKK